MLSVVSGCLLFRYLTFCFLSPHKLIVHYTYILFISNNNLKNKKIIMNVKYYISRIYADFLEKKSSFNLNDRLSISLITKKKKNV